GHSRNLETYSEATMFRTPVRRIKRMRYRYESGWMVKQTGAAPPTRGPPQEPGAGPGTGRVLVFTTNTPAPVDRACRVNDGPWRERPTQVEGVQRSTESATELSEVNFRAVFRRSHSPRDLERN